MKDLMTTKQVSAFLNINEKMMYTLVSVSYTHLTLPTS